MDTWVRFLTKNSEQNEYDLYYYSKEQIIALSKYCYFLGDLSKDAAYLERIVEIGSTSGVFHCYAYRKFNDYWEEVCYIYNKIPETKEE